MIFEALKEKNMAGTKTRRPRTKVDPNETPEDKFIRLANQRGEKLLHTMKLLRNLASSYAYKVNLDLAQEWADKFQNTFDETQTAWIDAINKVKVGSEEKSTA